MGKIILPVTMSHSGLKVIEFFLINPKASELWLHPKQFTAEAPSRSKKKRKWDLARLLCPWNSLSKNTGVGSHSLLQGIFPIQGSNPGFPHGRQILYHLSHQGRPRILEWVAYPFSRGSFWARNQTGVSCIASRFFYLLSYQGSPPFGHSDKIYLKK